MTDNDLPEDEMDALEAEMARQEEAEEAALAAEEAETSFPPKDKPKAAPDAPAPSSDELVEEMRDRLMRALADAENTRRRAEREKEDAYKYANTRFARDLLSVADNFRRALDSVDAEAKAAGGEALQNLLDGIAITERELLNAFEKHNVKQVAPAIGDKFDPNVHQAIAEVPGTGQANGTVYQVTQVGYLIDDRLLRPAMVIVARGGSAPSRDDSEA